MFWNREIVKPAECPVCQQAESVKILKVTVQAGKAEQHVGWVRDCVHCGERFTALFSGRVVKQRRNTPQAMAERVAAAAKGAPENALSQLPVDVNDLDGLL